MNPARCTSHEHNPPIADMAGARHWAGRMASLSIPGALTDFLSYRYPDRCCAAGAYAFYLGQAALRESLAGEGPACETPSVPISGLVSAAISANARVCTDPTRPILAAMRTRAAVNLITAARDDLAAYVMAAALRTATQGEGPAWSPAPAIPNDITSGVAAIAAVTARFPDLRARSCDAMPYLPGHPCQATYTLTAGVRMATKGE